MNQTIRQPIPLVVLTEAALEFLIGMSYALAAGDHKKQLDELEGQLERLKRASQSSSVNASVWRPPLTSASSQRLIRPAAGASGRRSEGLPMDESEPWRSGFSGASISARRTR